MDKAEIDRLAKAAIAERRANEVNRKQLFADKPELKAKAKLAKAVVATKSVAQKKAAEALKKFEARNTEKLSDAEPARDVLNFDDLPRPAFWMLLVEPRMPKKKQGLIEIAESAQDIEKIQTTVGRIIQIGPLAFKGKNESGLDLSVEAPRMVEGAYIMFARYTGQRVIVLSGSGERSFLLINDSDVMAVVPDPDKIRFWL